VSLSLSQLPGFQALRSPSPSSNDPSFRWSQESVRKRRELQQPLAHVSQRCNTRRRALLAPATTITGLPYLSLNHFPGRTEGIPTPFWRPPCGETAPTCKRASLIPRMHTPSSLVSQLGAAMSHTGSPTPTIRPSATGMDRPGQATASAGAAPARGSYSRPTMTAAVSSPRARTMWTTATQ
jgi:hypothetical protein